MRQIILLAEDWELQGQCPIHGVGAMFNPEDGTYTCFQGGQHKFMEVQLGSPE